MCSKKTNLEHGVSVALNLRREIDRQRHKRFGELHELIDGRLVLGIALVSAAVLTTNARYLECVAVEDGGHLAQPAPAHGRLGKALGEALERHRLASLRVQVLRDLADVRLTEYVQFLDLEDLTFVMSKENIPYNLYVILVYVSFPFSFICI